MEQVSYNRQFNGLRRDYVVYAWLLLFSFALLLVMGTDGWFRGPTNMSDTTWFFLCGKSWMSGLTPYVDFTDSKGPLLWLIYGLGYLISPYNLHGVFLFEVIFYWLTFCILYKTAMIILHQRAQSMLAAMLLSFIYFYPAAHFEILTEDYCHLFNALTFYVLVQLFFRRTFRSKYAFLMGLSCGCAMMIKYVYLATLLIPSFLILIYIWRTKIFSPWRYVACFLGGMGVIVLPFIIYFLCTGALSAFIDEYFYNTGATIVNFRNISDAEGGSFRQRWPFTIIYLYDTNHYRTGLMLTILCGLILGLVKFRNHKWLMAILLIWYAGCVLLFSLNDGVRYYMSMGIFAFGGIVAVVGLLRGLNLAGSLISGGCLLAVMVLISTTYIYSEFYFAENYRLGYQNMKKVAAIINAREIQMGRRPTITFYKCGDWGESMETNAVAGTRYFAAQLAMTPGMLHRHRDDIITQHPDFVVAFEDEANFLENYGYVPVLKYMPRYWATEPEEFRILYEYKE